AIAGMPEGVPTMLLIYRLGLIAAVSVVAVIAGLSVAFLASPRSSPILFTSDATIAAFTAVPTVATVARQPVPTVPASSTAAPLPAAVPVRSAAEIFQQVKATIADMRSGRLEALIDYGNSNRSLASVVFDLGTDQLPAKFAITTTYEGASGRQTAQRTTIGERTWQRQADATWSAQPAEESASGELQAFLPAFDSIKDPQVSAGQEGLLALQWADANGADITLLIDPDTNIPRQMRQLARNTGTLFTVTYQGWNAPVEINPPN
ncbi:MAG: hypothetical protein ABI901_06585, partial [Roseiflexaceae bacterium]